MFFGIFFAAPPLPPTPLLSLSGFELAPLLRGNSSNPRKKSSPGVRSRGPFRAADGSVEWAAGRSERGPFLAPVLCECECGCEAQGLLVLQLPTKGLFQAQPAALNDIS